MSCRGRVWAQTSTLLNICGTISLKNWTRCKTNPHMLQNFRMSFTSFGRALHWHEFGGWWESADDAARLWYQHGVIMHAIGCVQLSLYFSVFTFVVCFILFILHRIKSIYVSNPCAFASLFSLAWLRAKWPSQIMRYVNFVGNPAITKLQNDLKFF